MAAYLFSLSDVDTAGTLEGIELLEGIEETTLERAKRRAVELQRKIDLVDAKKNETDKALDEANISLIAQEDDVALLREKTLNLKIESE